MHELSIIYNIIDIVEEEVRRQAPGGKVVSLSLEIGRLAGVETDALAFLWDAAVSNTLLEGAEWQIISVQGKGQCRACGRRFAVEQYFDPCPDCGSFDVAITDGEQMRVKQLILEKHPSPLSAD